MAKISNDPCYVLGVEMTEFIKPRRKIDYTELGYEADIKASLDVHINYDQVEQGIACYAFGDGTCGQRVFYPFGMTEILIFNLNNACATRSTSLYLGRAAFSSGTANCVFVVGFENMNPGSTTFGFNDRASSIGTTTQMMKETRGLSKAPEAAQIVGNPRSEYIESKYFVSYTRVDAVQ